MRKDVSRHIHVRKDRRESLKTVREYSNKARMYRGQPGEFVQMSNRVYYVAADGSFRRFRLEKLKGPNERAVT